MSPAPLLAIALLAQAAAQPTSDPTPVAAGVTATRWVRGQPVQLMVLHEVNSRQVKPGDRFPLRVNAPVIVDGVVAVPVGASAWGEVVAASGTGIAGGKGHLSMRLVRLDAPTGPIALTGMAGTEGKANTAGVVMGMLAFGLGGLLIKGGNATLKAGDLVTGYIDEGSAPATGPLVVRQ